MSSSLPASRPVGAIVAALVLLAVVGCSATPIVDDPLLERVYGMLPTGVTASNDGGVITLNGFIQGVGNGQQIAEAVAQVPGVTAVDSNLIVRGGGV